MNRSNLISIACRSSRYSVSLIQTALYSCSSRLLESSAYLHNPTSSKQTQLWQLHKYSLSRRRQLPPIHSTPIAAVRLCLFLRPHTTSIDLLTIIFHLNGALTNIIEVAVSLNSNEATVFHRQGAEWTAGETLAEV